LASAEWRSAHDLRKGVAAPQGFVQGFPGAQTKIDDRTKLTDSSCLSISSWQEGGSCLIHYLENH